MPDPITSTLPDPQATVDAALGTSSTPTKMDTLPTPPVEPAVSVAPVTPEIPAMPVAPVAPVSVAMGDDTPLAFAAPSLNTMPSTPTPTPEAPKVEPMPTSVGSSYLPPVPPAPISTPPAEDKPKKSKAKSIIIGLVAFLTLASTGGYVAFNMYGSGSIPNISIVSKQPKNIKDPSDCSGESNGGWLVWRNGECKVTGISGSPDNNGDGVGDKDTTNPAVKNIETMGQSECQSSGSGGQWCQSVDSNNTPYAFCMPNDGSKGTCNNRAVELGYTITYGAGVSTVADATHKYKCSCGGKDYFFDKKGVCNSGGVTWDVSTGASTSNFDVSLTTNSAYYDKWGLCGLLANKADATGLSDYFDCFRCDAKKCQIISTAGVCASCTTLKYSCKEQTKTACLDNPTAAALTTTSDGKCGTVEQIDVMCNGQYMSSTTVLNGACDQTTAVDNPATHKVCNTTTKVCETVAGAGADTCATDANCVTTAPVLACTGLTQTPTTTPVIGDKLTFTCAGTITPTGAAALSYKFRYKVDSGADTLMINKTATTAELTIDRCGTYSVQCKVCATISGVLTCDPVWTGAVQ